MEQSLVSMAKTAAEKERETRPYEDRAAEEIDDYSWNLTVRLNHDDLVKLGLAGGELDAEDMWNMQAVVQVTEAETRTTNGETRRSASLQIQQMALSPKAEEKSKASKMFGENDET